MFTQVCSFFAGVSCASIMEEGGSQDEGFSDSEVVYEEDVVEVVDLDPNGPPEDGTLAFILLVMMLSVVLFCSSC